jgi:hypothetical protein
MLFQYKQWLYTPVDPCPDTSKLAAKKRLILSVVLNAQRVWFTHGQREQKRILSVSLS